MAKYTALEVLTAAGVENPESIFGKLGISIGGIVVNTPNHLINIVGDSKVNVRVGKESIDIDMPEREEVSEAVKAAIVEKGNAATEDFAARHPERFEAKD